MTSFGRYELVRLLQSGASSELFLARASGPGDFEKLLVLKRTTLEHASDPQLHARFLAEARLAARLDHPNVVQVFDFGTEGGQDYLTMEHVEGPTLRQLIDRGTGTSSPFPIEIAVTLVTQVLDAIAYVHALNDDKTGEPLGLVHRDLSPDSVLVSSSGIAKLTNFGLTRQAEATQTGSLATRLAWSAPEVLDKRRTDARADLFSIGAVLYEALTLSLPFQGSTPAELLESMRSGPPRRPSLVRPGIPDVLDTAIASVLALDPEQRVASATALRETFDVFLATQPPVMTEALAAFVARGGGDDPTTRKLPGALGAIPAAARPVNRSEVQTVTSAPRSSPPRARSLPTVPDGAARESPSSTVVDLEPVPTAPPPPLQEGDTAVVPRAVRDQASIPTNKLPDRRTPRDDPRAVAVVVVLTAAILVVATVALLTPEAGGPPTQPRPAERVVPSSDAPPSAPSAPAAPVAAAPPKVESVDWNAIAPAPAATAAPRTVVRPTGTRLWAPAPTRPAKRGEVLVTASVKGQAAPACLSVDGQYEGTTPHYLSRPPGKVLITAVVKGYPPRDAEISVSAGQGSTMNFEMVGEGDDDKDAIKPLLKRKVPGCKF